MADGTQTIAISTYNRRKELSACLTCLGAIRGLDRWRGVICDDASTEYDIGAIAKNATFECATTRNPSNLGCDANNVAMLRSCLDDGASRIFLLDSDMIVARDVLEFIDSVFDRTDGVLSVYNSVLHPEGEIIDADLVSKLSIGAAATIWDATLLRAILNRLDGVQSWDWQMCRIVRELDVRLCVARQSRAQHIGIAGVHSLRFEELEFGSGFSVETTEQAHALAAAHETLMLSQKAYACGKAPETTALPPPVARYQQAAETRENSSVHIVKQAAVDQGPLSSVGEQ